MSVWHTVHPTSANNLSNIVSIGHTSALCTFLNSHLEIFGYRLICTFNVLFILYFWFVYRIVIFLDHLSQIINESNLASPFYFSDIGGNVIPSHIKYFFMQVLLLLKELAETSTHYCPLVRMDSWALSICQMHPLATSTAVRTDSKGIVEGSVEKPRGRLGKTSAMKPPY